MLNIRTSPLWRLWSALWLALSLACLSLTCLPLPGYAQTSSGKPQPVPALTARAMDSSGTLSAQELQTLEQQLKALEDSTGAQVVVLMVPSTAPEDIASYAYRVASSWKIGRKDIGDGVLIIVAKNDRRMRIEVARRLEGAIPDILAGRIIDDAMKPRFRTDDYAGGLSAAIDQVGKLIRGEKLPAPTAPAHQASKSSQSFNLESLLPFAFFGFFIGMPLARSIFGKGLGSIIIGGVAGIAGYVLSASLLISGIAGVLAMIFTLLGSSKARSGGGGPYISTGGGGWGSGGRGGGGGGFSSGGGGSFGGGGASGGW